MVRWFAPVLPEARVAILRTVLYLFVLVDIHLSSATPIPLSRHPELYWPLLLDRVLTCRRQRAAHGRPLRRAAGQLHRGRGQPAAAGGRLRGGGRLHLVDRDRDELRQGRPRSHGAGGRALGAAHRRCVVAGRWRSGKPSAQAGWALKCIQIAVVLTYFLSALTKIRSGAGA